MSRMRKLFCRKLGRNSDIRPSTYWEDSGLSFKKRKGWTKGPPRKLFEFLCVLQELGQSEIRQRMLQEAQDRFQRRSNNVGAGFCALYNMQWTADGSSEDLCFVALYRIDLGNLRDQLNTI